MNPYEKYILPFLIDMSCGAKPVRYQRRKIVPEAHGIVLEIGIGSGRNLPYYNPNKVTRVIGVDPSAALWAKASATAEAVPFEVIHYQTTTDDMPVDRHSVDTVVVTYTLCSIPDAAAALQAARPTLKPGGSLLFCEHGLAPDANVEKWQHRINPVWRRISGGCEIDRPIPALIEAGGYRIRHMETMYLPGTPRFTGFNYWGAAEPA
jgi:SAM-dependent methyltransferase